MTTAGTTDNNIDKHHKCNYNIITRRVPEMLVDIIAIGNSKGIRIPKKILEACELEGQVEMLVQDHELLIRSPKKSRHGWGDAFRAMSKSGDDQLLDSDIVGDWDKNEWQWDE